MAIVPAVDALTLAHHGEARRARESMEHALRLLKSLGRVGPPVRAEAYAVLARVSLLSGDTTAAKELLRDLRPLVAAMPEAAGLRARVAELDADLQVVAEAIVGPLALTAAELRVLGYLPMHLSMSEIAEHLFVSRNTVKSQAIAIYRKLAVSSRGGAVARARELGLLDV
jgi:LuxR family maltose regulon positive regulatory protein